jgi:hypothetical protein
MPFSKTSSALIGRKLNFKPHCGNTWMLCVTGTPPVDLETPDEFDFVLRDVLFDQGEARVLIAELLVIISDQKYTWGALIARSDYFVNLEQESVHCNLILSKSKPSISQRHPYHDPSFVSANSEPYVRGFGVLSLPKAP